MDKTNFSVVIPLLNSGPYVGRAINSVLSQTYPYFEILVVDGGSNDNGPDLVENIEPLRVRLIKQKGDGVSAARNQGVELSNTNYIAFLDADDEWMPDHLETLVRLIEQYPEAGAYTTSYFRYGKNGKIRPARIKCIPPSPWEGIIPSYFKSASRGESPIWTSVVCIPKIIFNEMGGFPIDAYRGEDLDLWGKIALKYPIAFNWNHSGIYHNDAGNQLSNRPSPLNEAPFVTSFRNYMSDDSVSPHVCMEDLQEYVNRLEIHRASQNLLAGYPGKSRAILKTCENNCMRQKCLSTFLFLATFMPRILITTYQKRWIGIKD